MMMNNFWGQMPNAYDINRYVNTKVSQGFVGTLGVGLLITYLVQANVKKSINNASCYCDGILKQMGINRP